MKRTALIAMLAVAALSTGCAGFNQAVADNNARLEQEAYWRQKAWEAATPAVRQASAREQCRRQYEETVNPTNMFGAMAIANDTVGQKFDRRENAKMTLSMCMDRASEQM
jgi:hypothetical protein